MSFIVLRVTLVGFVLSIIDSITGFGSRFSHPFTVQGYTRVHRVHCGTCAITKMVNPFLKICFMTQNEKRETGGYQIANTHPNNDTFTMDGW